MKGMTDSVVNVALWHLSSLGLVLSFLVFPGRAPARLRGRWLPTPFPPKMEGVAPFKTREVGTCF